MTQQPNETCADCGDPLGIKAKNAEIERLLKLTTEQGQEVAITRERDEALEDENRRLRTAHTRIAEAAGKAAMVPSIDVATALVFDELSRIAAGALASNEQKASVCPRCRTNPIEPNPIFLGTETEGHICGECWKQDRAKEQS